MKERIKKKFPIGIDDFEKLRQDDFYYVDKTSLIRDLLENWGEVNLFTRPRRFGKSLNMSMLWHFFDIYGNRDIFKGLEIAEETELCRQYMGQFPVIYLSLKGISANTYHGAVGMAIQMINAEVRRFQYLLDSKKLTKYDKEIVLKLLNSEMEEAVLCSSLKNLSELLYKHHGQKVILLIDEYDVPLAKAFDRGYYDEMILLIRNFLGQVLKTNQSLKFAVLTGCMRISKESVFTGLNNLSVFTVSDAEYDEYFGFTDQDVRGMLDYYGLMEQYDEMKEWYDGFMFGNREVYCPWDVMNHCRKLCIDRTAKPQNYWANTSGNDVVRQFIQRAGRDYTKKEIEKLVAGETITKQIHQELTYRDVYGSEDNIWSVLFATGYLTKRGCSDGKTVSLAIPNREIREIYTEQIMVLFREGVKENKETLNSFCKALESGNAEKVEQHFQEYLKRTISIRDTFVRRNLKENFYHGILIGILGYMEGWCISSNQEAGDGYSDIVLESADGEAGILIEIKYAHDGNLEKGCRDAIAQITKNHYEEELYDEGVERILKYGIACYKKRCRVQAAHVRL